MQKNVNVCRSKVFFCKALNNMSLCFMSIGELLPICHFCSWKLPNVYFKQEQIFGKKLEFSNVQLMSNVKCGFKTISNTPGGGNVSYYGIKQYGDTVHVYIFHYSFIPCFWLVKTSQTPSHTVLNWDVPYMFLMTL